MTLWSIDISVAVGGIESNRFIRCCRFFRVRFTNKFRYTFFFLFAFFPASCICMERSHPIKKSANHDVNEHNIVTQKCARIWSEKEFNATSLRNQFYSIFWCVVLCFSCVNLNEGIGEAKKNAFLCVSLCQSPGLLNLWFFVISLLVFLLYNNSLQSPLTLGFELEIELTSCLLCDGPRGLDDRSIIVWIKREWISGNLNSV